MIVLLRTEALQEILTSRGLSGVRDLALLCRDEPTVGQTLAALGLPIHDLAGWIVKEAGDLTDADPLAANLRSLLGSGPAPRARDTMKAVIAEGRSRGWGSSMLARFLTLGPQVRGTWDLAAECGEQVAEQYWDLVPLFWIFDEEPDLEYPVRRLLERDRPRTAFHSVSLRLEKAPAPLLAEILESVLLGHEEETPLQAGYIGEALERLETSGSIDDVRLIRLELLLLPALEYGDESKASHLFRAITSRPALFTELLCLAFRPGHAEGADEEIGDDRAEIAWRALSSCRRLPGQQSDGSVSFDELESFVDETRRLGSEADRLEACDTTLGEILAYAPPDFDGLWPCEPVRRLLERPGMERLREGFGIGVLNKRGVTSRAYWEGGDQERDLARQAKANADTIRSTHPMVASVLDEVAKHYEREGSDWDDRARLNLEGHR